MSDHAHSLDLDAAARQAIGSPFSRGKRDVDAVAELKAGSLVLSPHAPWDFSGGLDWTADPFQDSNWRHQLPMLRWLDPLRRAGERDDREASALWVRVARSWFDADRSEAARSAHSWDDMVDGYRAIELSIATPMLAQHHPGELQWVRQSLEDHAAWLADAEHLGHANHALVQHMGLFVVASVLRDAPRQQLAADRLADLFAESYDEQGVNAEGAIAYHYLNYVRWKEARRRLEVERFPLPPALEVLDRVPEQLAHATKPDGTFVNIGDTDGGSPKSLRHPYTDYVVSGGEIGEPPPDVVKVYDAGYVFGRSGWGEHERTLEEETYFSISFGAANRVHGHPDGLSLTFSALGREWLRDPGKFQYGRAAMRGYCLSRATHNVPVVMGVPYDATGSVALAEHRLGDRLLDFSFDDPGHEGVGLQRRVIYSVMGEYLIVIDQVTGDEERTAVQNWQTAPGVEVRQKPHGVELRSGDQAASIFSRGTKAELRIVEGQEDPLDGWVATGWKQKEAAARLRFRKRGERFRFVTLVVPHFAGREPEVDMRPGESAGSLQLTVFNGRLREHVSIDSNGARIIGAPRSGRSAASADDAHDDRSAVLDALARARAAAAAEPSPEHRSELARALLDSTEERRGSVVDLGATACIADLLEWGEDELAEPSRRRGLIDWSGRGAVRSPHESLPCRLAPSGDAPLTLPETDSVLTFQVGPLAMPVAWVPGSGDVLTVLLHGAVDRAKVQLPLFQRLRFQASLDRGPTVAIADPTLDLSSDLKLGWYLGAGELDLHAELARVIERLRIAAGARHVVVVGSSGGGFAALQAVVGLEHATAVAFSPQTDLDAYVARFSAAASLAAFGQRTLVHGHPWRPRTSVIERYAGLETLPRIHVISNTGDESHARHHVEPLRRLYAERGSDAGEVVELRLGTGHRSPSNQQYAAVMRPLLDEWR